jgi:proline iminopeptidase
VAQELALRHPERITRLVLVDTTPGQLGAGEDPQTYAGPPPPDEFLQMIATPPANDAALSAALERILPFYLHRADPREWAWVMAGTVVSASAMVRGFEVLSTWSSVDRLREITVPVLVAAGRHDVVTGFRQAHRIADRLPDAEVVIFEESGHVPWIDEPDSFFATVGAWLSRDP